MVADGPPRRGVARSSAPGAACAGAGSAAATQPHANRPPFMAVQGSSGTLVNRVTPQNEARTSELPHRRHDGARFAPVSVRGTILSPGARGGVNWPGGACDASPGLFFFTADNRPMKGTAP